MRVFAFVTHRHSGKLIKLPVYNEVFLMFNQIKNIKLISHKRESDKMDPFYLRAAGGEVRLVRNVVLDLQRSSGFSSSV